MAEIVPFTDPWRSRLVESFVEFSTGLATYDGMMATSREAMETYVGDLLAHEDVVALLLADGEILQGFMIGYPDRHLDEIRSTFYVSDLYVMPSLRSQGWGTKLLDEAESHARRLGLTAMRIGVLESNTRAETLYRKTGYEPHIRLLLKSLD